MGYEIVWEPRGACKRFFGQVSDAELMRSVVEIEGDHRFDAIRYVVNDFRAVEGFQVTEENVMTISAIDGAASITNPTIKIAIVAVDAAVRAMAELYANSPLNTYPTRIFAAMAEARAWAETPSDDLPPEHYINARLRARYRM